MGKVTVKCAGCRTKLSVSDDRLGKRVRCPRCGRVMEIPFGVLSIRDPSLQAQQVPRPTEFWASKASGKYHLPECRWGKLIEPGNLEVLKSADRLAIGRYIPCRRCRPESTPTVGC